jgi:hypothetical protein
MISNPHDAFFHMSLDMHCWRVLVRQREMSLLDEALGEVRRLHARARGCASFLISIYSSRYEAYVSRICTAPCMPWVSALPFRTHELRWSVVCVDVVRICSDRWWLHIESLARGTYVKKYILSIGSTFSHDQSLNHSLINALVITSSSYFILEANIRFKNCLWINPTNITQWKY